MEAPIFKGPGAGASAPCSGGTFSLCFRLSFTVWVTPENEFAKRQLRYSTCFTAGFSGSPIGCPITFFSAHHIPVHKAANILMWSHYGDRHKGICLGFDVADELTRPVEYVADVLVLGNLMVQKRSEFSEDQGITILDRMFGFKYDGWSY